MKCRFIITIAYFLILVVNTGTAYAQNTSQCEGVCYTDKQDIAALQCAVNSIIKDSIIAEKINQINLKSKQLEKKDSIIHIMGSRIDLRDEKIIQVEMQRDKALKSSKWKMAGAGVVGIIVGVTAASIIK